LSLVFPDKSLPSWTTRQDQEDEDEDDLHCRRRCLHESNDDSLVEDSRVSSKETMHLENALTPLDLDLNLKVVTFGSFCRK
jgi:hypothetical protein